MTLPAGTTPESVVKKVRPIFDLAVNLKPETWLDMLSTLAETEPEAVVRAVYPDADLESMWPGWVVRLGADLLAGYCDTEADAWHSAALRIVEELKGEGR